MPQRSRLACQSSQSREQRVQHYNIIITSASSLLPPHYTNIIMRRVVSVSSWPVSPCLLVDDAAVRMWFVTPTLVPMSHTGEITTTKQRMRCCSLPAIIAMITHIAIAERPLRCVCCVSIHPSAWPANCDTKKQQLLWTSPSSRCWKRRAMQWILYVPIHLF